MPAEAAGTSFTRAASPAHARDVQRLLGAVVPCPEAPAPRLAALRGALFVTALPPLPPVPHPGPWIHTAKIGWVSHSWLQRHIHQSSAAELPVKQGPAACPRFSPTPVLRRLVFTGFPKLEPDVHSSNLVITLARPGSSKAAAAVSALVQSLQQDPGLVCP